MILTSTTETTPFTPTWLKDKPGSPVFHLRAGSVIERGQMEAELAGPHRAGRVIGWELRQAVRNGITTLLADDPEVDRVIEANEAEAEVEARAIVLDAAGDFDAASKVREELTAEDRRLLIETRAVLAEHWPEYRDLVAQMERRNQIAPIVALKRFCAGWENAKTDAGADVPFESGRDGQVTDAALRRLSSLELFVAGQRAYNLQYPAGEEGNSPRPSSSDDGQKTSSSDDTSTADGKSATGAGKRTRGSRSPRGSGR